MPETSYSDLNPQDEYHKIILAVDNEEVTLIFDATEVSLGEAVDSSREGFEVWPELVFAGTCLGGNVEFFGNMEIEFEFLDDLLN